MNTYKVSPNAFAAFSVTEGESFVMYTDSDQTTKARNIKQKESSTADNMPSGPFLMNGFFHVCT